jgi:uncharacterized cupin superfamily protein
MPATATDRIDGLTTSVAVKAPCKVASTANITLSGPQTISGVAVVAGDRVLVTAQTNAVDNGIWVVQAGTWKRAKDFDGQRDVVQGTMVLVGPQDSARRFYGVITPNPIVIGTTEIEFDEFDPTEEQLRVDLADTTNPANGAALVGFLPSGAGAVGSTVQTKLRRWVDLADHGILPGGDPTVNATKLQTLINEVSAAGGGDIAGYAGTYNFASQLKPANGVTFRGIIGKTIFRLDNSAATSANLFAHNTDGLDGSLDDFGMDGIILDGNGKDAAFLALGCQRLRFKDCVFRNAGTYGCGLQARPGFTVALPQDDIQFLRCGFENNGSDSPGWDGLDIKWCTHTKLISCWATGNTDAGLNIRGFEVDLIGCTAEGNGTAGILLQSTDTTEDSFIRVVGGGATGTTAGPGLEIQGNNGRLTYVMVSGFQSYLNTGSGVRVSGSGLVAGKIDVQSRGNTAHGLQITGDYVQHLVVTGLLTGNSGNGVDTAGKNTIFDGLWIVSNTGTGYRENTGADNNFLMPNCVIDGNGVADIGARVGVESSDGFLSVTSKQELRVLPGRPAGLALRADSGGANATVAAVGDGASVDLNLFTKGNGSINGYKDNGARQLYSFRPAGSVTVNYPDFVASLTGNSVQYRAAGSDTNIDLELVPKGTGLVRFGTRTASADAPVTGYIEIKDSGGTTRRLAIIG